MANYRNRRLLDLAHALHECTARLPGLCLGYSPHGLEPAHSNQSCHGKGLSLKAHDVFHAALCHPCHAALDQGRQLSRAERVAVWSRAFEATYLEYFRRGWLHVVDERANFWQTADDARLLDCFREGWLQLSPLAPKERP